MQSLPQVSFLDGLDRLGQPSYSTADSPCDIPGLENYVDLLLLSDAGNNEVVSWNIPTDTMYAAIANNGRKMQPQIFRKYILE